MIWKGGSRWCLLPYEKSPTNFLYIWFHIIIPRFYHVIHKTLVRKIRLSLDLMNSIFLIFDHDSSIKYQVSVILPWRRSSRAMMMMMMMMMMEILLLLLLLLLLYSDLIMGSMVSQITSLTIFYSTVYSGADERTHKSSASLAFVRGIHRTNGQ